MHTAEENNAQCTGHGQVLSRGGGLFQGGLRTIVAPQRKMPLGLVCRSHHSDTKSWMTDNRDSCKRGERVYGERERKEGKKEVEGKKGKEDIQSIALRVNVKTAGMGANSML